MDNKIQKPEEALVPWVEGEGQGDLNESATGVDSDTYMAYLNTPEITDDEDESAARIVEEVIWTCVS